MKMIQKTPLAILASLSLLAMAPAARATVIDFTGGTVTRLDSSTETTSNSVSWDNVDYYEENGFRLDFLPDSGSTGFASHVGNYYGAGNDVIHTHWSTGDFGGVTEVRITKIGGGTFDLNYFILTSNTDTGGSLASGLESAWIKNNMGYEQLLPVENWGFPATQIFLGSDFDSVTAVSFFVKNAVDCFGMDEFFIDEPAPPAVPDSGATLSLLGLAMIALVAARRKLIA
jgi:hypothetical protein